MQNKAPARNWTDIRMIFSSISVAVTLGFWGLFASTEKTKSGAVEQINSNTPDPVALPQPQMMLLPGQKLLFGSTTSPQPQTVTVVKSNKSKKGGGGGGGGGGGPVGGTTGSSKP